MNVISTFLLTLYYLAQGIIAAAVLIALAEAFQTLIHG